MYSFNDRSEHFEVALKKPRYISAIVLLIIRIMLIDIRLNYIITMFLDNYSHKHSAKYPKNTVRQISIKKYHNNSHSVEHCRRLSNTVEQVPNIFPQMPKVQTLSLFNVISANR